jgi:hypothetical protein
VRRVERERSEKRVEGCGEAARGGETETYEKYKRVLSLLRPRTPCGFVRS